jgi:sugar/nucleoside kinase (ribokinase family)
VADRPTLVVVGAASRDRDEHEPRGWRLGGGVTYASLAAARLGVDVHSLIGVDAEAGRAHELDVLRAAGVDVRLVPIGQGPVFDNRQTTGGRIQYSDGPSDSIPTSSLLSDWRAPNAAILAPVAAEISDAWASAFNPRTTVAVGLQGLLRKFVPGGAVEPLPVRRTALVDRAGLMHVSAEDVAAGSAPLSELVTDGQELVLTNGASGALWIGAGSMRYLPTTPIGDAIDTTGAGDVFLGSWVAARTLLGEAAAWRSLLVASTAASLSVLRTGISGVPTDSDISEAIALLKRSH